MSRIFSVGGGKGGVGKSFIAANLGVLFAEQGKRVALVDLDLGASNLHTFLGIREPKVGIDDFLRKAVKELEDVALPTIIPNLYVICSMNCSLEIANLFHVQKLKIIKAIQNLPFDYVLLDLGAGTHFNTLDFFLTSDEGLFILTPEPTAIENTLRFIKSVYNRKLKQLLKQRAFNVIVKDFFAESNEATIKLTDIIEYVMEHDPVRGQLLESKLTKSKFSIVLNEFRKQISPTLGQKIEKVCNRHFYSKFQFLGNVTHDESVHHAVFSRDIYIKKHPYAPAATDLQLIARKLTETKETKISVLPYLP
jgi:flagellar biosynthesis protein FlhG